MNNFDIKREFPNYFNDVVEKMKLTSRYSHAAAISRVEHLISANMQSLLNRLNLAYVDKNGIPATTRFFEELLNRMRSELPKDIDKNDLEIYISGGVVRALLAYIYKELHIKFHSKPETNLSQDKVKRAEQMQLTSGYLQIKNVILNMDMDSYSPINYEKLKDEFLGSDKAGETKKMDFILALCRYISEKKRHNLPDDFDSQIEPELFKQYSEFHHLQHQREQAQLWHAMADIEYYLLRSYMIEQTPLSQAFVLGVGSDLDILYELKGHHENAHQIKMKLERTATQFINSARAFFEKELSEIPEDLQNSIVPLGDVKDYQEQIPSVLNQGGSMLDTLAFKIEINSEVSNKASHIREPTIHVSTVPVMEHFINGVFDYIANVNASQKQTIRGLRALLEIPFLQFTDEGKKVIVQELTRLKDSIQNNKLSKGAQTQVKKMIRNTNFYGANNRAYRESPDQPLSIFLDMITKVPINVETTIQRSFPAFLESFRNKSQPNKHKNNIEGSLITVQNFISNYLKDGKLYHGTASENILPILRSGFLISSSAQGNAVFGSGLYTSSHFEKAKSYGSSDGHVITLDINQSMPLRIIDINKLNPSILEKLNDEANQYKMELNELLRTHYQIDIICNTHIIIQNIDAIIRPKNLLPFIEYISSKLSTLKGKMSASSLEEYEKLQQFANVVACDTTKLPSKEQIIIEYLVKQKNNIMRAIEDNEYYSTTNAQDQLLKTVNQILPLIVNANTTKLKLLLDNEAYFYRLIEYSFNERLFPPSQVINALQDDKNIILIAIKRDPKLLALVNQEMSNDNDIAMAAVTKNGIALEFVGESLKNDEDIAITAVNNNSLAFQFIGELLKNNENIAMAAVRQNGMMLQFAGESLKNNKDIVMASVRQNSMALAFAGESLKNNKDIVMAAVRQNGMMLQFASESLKNNEDIVMAAVKQNGMALEFASESLKNNKNIVMTAIAEDVQSLKLATLNIRNDKEVVFEALKRNTNAIIHASEILQKDALIQSIITAYPSSDDVFYCPDFTDENDVATVYFSNYEARTVALDLLLNSDNTLFVKKTLTTHPEMFRFVPTNILENHEIIKEFIQEKIITFNDIPMQIWNDINKLTFVLSGCPELSDDMKNINKIDSPICISTYLFKKGLINRDMLRTEPPSDSDSGFDDDFDDDIIYTQKKLKDELLNQKKRSEECDSSSSTSTPKNH